MVWSILNSVGALAAVGLGVWTLIVNRRLEQARMRPELIIVDRHISSGLQMQYGLYVCNVGKSTAINVEIPDQFISAYPFLSEWRKIRRDLGPGAETMCATGPEMFVPQISNLLITYEDSDHREHSMELNDGRLSFK